LLYKIEAKELLNQKEAADLQRRIDALTGEQNRRKKHYFSTIFILIRQNVFMFFVF